MSKQRYLCIEGKKIPVSKKIYQVYYQLARKERYFSEDLKREKLLYDTEQQIAVLLPSREDSYERLLEQDRQFSDPNVATPEDDTVSGKCVRCMTVPAVTEVCRRQYLHWQVCLLRIG